MEKPRLVDMSKGREGSERNESWHVGEVFSEARDADRGSEDAYLITDHCIAVFDGVSTPKDPMTENRTPGQWAIETVRAAFANDPDLRAENAAKHATDALRAVVSAHNLEHVPSLVFIAFFPKQNRIVRVGDCSFLIDGVGNNPGIMPDRAKAELRRRILEKQLDAGATTDELFENDPSKDRLKELRVWQHTYANNDAAPDFGYGVVNGTDIPESLVEYISVPEGTKSIILASDGYPVESLHETLAETERSLRDMQIADPLGIGENPSVRAHQPRYDQTATDDRTYIKIVP